MDTHTDKTVRLRLVVTGPGGAAHPSQLTNGRNAPTPNIAWIGTVAGEARHDQAGWAYTITRPGNNQTHTPCHTIDEAYGPVVTNTRHPAYLGATAPTHTDAHLTGLAELLRSLGGIKNLPAGSGIIQSTSATALAYMTGHRPPQQHLHVAAQVVNFGPSSKQHMTSHAGTSSRTIQNIRRKARVSTNLSSKGEWVSYTQEGKYG